MNKLSTIEEVQKSLQNVPGDAKSIWKLQYPIIDPAKVPEIKKALYGFEEWSKDNNVIFKSKTNRKFTLKGFKFDYTVAVEFNGTLMDIGLVLSNYIEILRSVNLVPSDTEPHLHSINAETEIERAQPVNDVEEDEPWDDCDEDCYDCEYKDECPNSEY